jgi:hypothetical protein
MATRTCTLPLEQLLTARYIANEDRSCTVESRAHKSDDAREICVRETEWRHTGRRATFDHACEPCIVERLPKHTTPQVDTRDLIAVAAVAELALRRIHAATGGDIFLRVLTGMIGGE